MSTRVIEAPDNPIQVERAWTANTHNSDMRESVQSVPKSQAVSCELRPAKEVYWHIQGEDLIDSRLRAAVCITPLKRRCRLEYSSLYAKLPRQ
jgi:hypothetical protein